jgi:hypothetical protein
MMEKVKDKVLVEKVPHTYSFANWDVRRGESRTRSMNIYSSATIENRG